MHQALFQALWKSRDAEFWARWFKAAGRAGVQSVSPAVQAWLLGAMAQQGFYPLVAVAGSPRALDQLYQDLTALSQGVQAGCALFPARQERPGQVNPPPADLVGDRLATLQACLQPQGPQLILTCLQALFEPLLPPAALQAAFRTVRLQEATAPENLADYLATNGYAFEPEVLAKGQAARRGGILDVWPPAEPWPVRLEFFGDVLDSIRRFNPEGQRTRETLRELLLLPAHDTHTPVPAAGGAVTLADYLPPATAWAWLEPDSLCTHFEMLRAITPTLPHTDFFAWREMHMRRFSGAQLSVGPDEALASPAHELDVAPLESVGALTLPGRSPDLIEEEREKLIELLARRAREGFAVEVFFNTPGGRDRFMETHGKRHPFAVRVAPLSEGFLVESANLLLVAESDLFGVRKRAPGRYELHGKRAGARARTGDRLADWTDLQPGELVVHVDHGIGKYLGLFEIQFDGRLQETLAIEYADNAKLYVPTSQTHLLSRYVGVGRVRPALHTLGGKRWTREKLAAERAVQDLAAMMLDTQARRDTLQGFAFAADTTWQHEFEATFPYQETDDQQQAIADVKKDMEKPRPMDRLICGDVGYGKTEVAMRAAFKAVMNGKQVAVLVPTTILAQQHFDTFRERMAAFPVVVEMLSRFRGRAEQAEIARRVREHQVDIVVGTHRLLQRDVQFKDLGLVIIDEEQRFGVAHKEHFKSLRQLVDVLTLTATPIPRTLYLSMTGARDMSIIQTPPQDRLPVETVVAQNADAVVREAVLRELNRGGQVFFLHNRVQSIEHVYKRLQALVPQARVEIGHGQMHEKELADVMHRFVRGEFDVLLCTTIIESGVDIPNVNTILIDRADRFGMADLYQLRGRVGRYKHKAYAYLLLPRHGRLFDNARQRIGAIKRYASLGAGFKLAVRDLEIRGAGNLLGAEQSGHIATVGFDLYCQLLNRTVAQLKGEPARPIIDVELKLDFLDLTPDPRQESTAAVIPRRYVEDENLRISLYRKIAGTAVESELDALYEEFRDRFGPVPSALDRLLKATRLRIVAATQGLRSIAVEDGKVILQRGAGLLMPHGRFPRLRATDPTAALHELIELVRRLKAEG